MTDLAAKHELDLSGLDSLSSMLTAPATSTGAPLLIDLDLIEEDPGNSRGPDNPGFSQESIGGLAEQLKRSGIKTPLSLRPNPDKPGRYIINHGHRRFRAARLAGLSVVPAFIDSNHDDIDQFVENIQREDLTGREIADFIGRKLSEGMTQAEIARVTGKSTAWVSQHARMLNLPDPIAHAVASGTVSDVTVANELAKAHAEAPEAVAALLAAGTPVTRGAAKAARRPKVGKAKAQDRRKGATVAAGEHAGGIDTAPDRDSASVALQQLRELNERAAAGPGDEELAALRRLIDIAQGETGQARRVADFLLAWWNAGQCGGFDMTATWGVDADIAADMVIVFAMVARVASYPDKLDPTFEAAFSRIVAQWRPELLQ